MAWSEPQRIELGCKELDSLPQGTDSRYAQRILSVFVKTAATQQDLDCVRRTVARFFPLMARERPPPGDPADLPDWWRTLGRALWGNASRTSSNSNEAARAGDVVMVSGGPFTAPSTNERNIPAFNPVNSGTATAPIEIRAVGRVDLRTTGGNGPAMGSYMRNYIHWIGHFYIDEANSTVRADTGTGVGSGSAPCRVTCCRVGISFSPQTCTAANRNVPALTQSPM